MGQVCKLAYNSEIVFFTLLLVLSINMQIMPLQKSPMFENPNLYIWNSSL